MERYQAGAGRFEGPVSYLGRERARYPLLKGNRKEEKQGDD